MGKALTEVSQEILELAELCRSNSGIDPELYKIHDVKRGLRDLNGNGVVAAADARKALRASVKLETLTPQQILVADVDPNPGVTAADARLILRASVKIETLLL